MVAQGGLVDSGHRVESSVVVECSIGPSSYFCQEARVAAHMSEVTWLSDHGLAPLNAWE
jgi:hypothetical protein